MVDPAAETPGRMTPAKRRRPGAWAIQLAVAVAISVVLMGFIFHLVSPAELVATVGQTSRSLFVLSVVLVGLMYGVRAVKYRLALGDLSIGHRDWWTIIAVYSMLKNAVPFRVGEFSLPALLGRKYGTPVGKSMLVLYVGLASDLVSLLFIGSLALAGAALSTSSVVLTRSTVVAFVFLAVGTCLYYAAQHVPRFFHRRLDGRFSGNTLRSAVRLLDTTASALGSYSASRLTTFLALSTLTWVIRFWVIALLLPAWGVNLSFFEVSTATSIMSLFNALPIQGLAGFGTTEAGWALAFTMFGLPLETSVRSSFAVHVVTIALMLIHFLIGLILYTTIRGRVGDAAVPARDAVEAMDGGGA